MSTIHYDLNKIQRSISIVGTSGIAYLPTGMANIMKQFICEPAITSNTYTVRLKNTEDTDMEMFERDGDGQVNDLTDFPIYGTYKVELTSVSSPDTFKIRILYL